MHWTFLHSFLSFYSILFKSEIQLAWIHFTFCVVAPWEDSIWSPLCPTNPFSVASWHTFLLIFSPHDSTALQPSASPVPLPPQPAWSLPLLLTTPTSWVCEGESRPLHNKPRPFLSLPVPYTNSLPGSYSLLSLLYFTFSRARNINAQNIGVFTPPCFGIFLKENN